MLPLAVFVLCLSGASSFFLPPERCIEGKTYQMRQCGYELQCHGSRIMRHRVATASPCTATRETPIDALPTCSVPGYKVSRSAHPSDCSRYLERRVWMFSERRCPKGASFNSTSCECEESTVCLPTLPAQFRPFPIPNMADKYEIEAHENAVVQCLPGEHFNEIRAACEQKPKTLPTNDSESLQVPEGPCKQSMRSDGYRNHPSDCSKFFQCAHGKWVQMDCPEGLVFDLELVRCDYPKK